MLKRFLIYAVVVSGLGVVVVAGCYSPNITSGGFQCAAVGGKQCPDNFVCQGGQCVKSGTTGTGGVSATGGRSGTGGAGGMTGTGGAGGAAPGTRMKGQTCLLRQDMSHDCMPGLLCIEDCANARCYQPCQGDGECPESSCRPATASRPRVCEFPYTMCTPTDTAGGGCVAGRSCYLLSSQPVSGTDRTVCDCSSAQSGTGQPCSESRDCFAGLTCPPPGSPGENYCRRVCDPASPAAACGATTCRPFGPKWGYCYL